MVTSGSLWYRKEGLYLATHSVLIKRRNAANNGYDNILPVTTAENVLTADGDILDFFALNNMTRFKISTLDSLTGVPVDNIELKIKNIDSSLSYVVTTNSDGYLNLLLPIGEYTISLNKKYLGLELLYSQISSNSDEPYLEYPDIFKQHNEDIITTSGTYYLPNVDTIDLFLVGGGGGGGAGHTSDTTSRRRGGGGGGGGYVKTVLNCPVAPRQEVSVIIGAGGAGAPDNNTSNGAGAGGTTSILGHSAAGGRGGFSGKNGGSYVYGTNTGAGGDGGSGGGGAGKQDTAAGNGGSNGSDGYPGDDNAGGVGSGQSTRAFGEPYGEFYGAGGGGGASGANNLGGIGGETGGGIGGRNRSAGNDDYRGADGSFYGAGGGGGNGYSNKTGYAGGNGHAGCVLVRW